MSLLQNSNAISTGGYNLESSLRFRSSANASLERTPTTSGNRKTFTWSGWVKLATTGTARDLFSVWDGTTNANHSHVMRVGSNHQLYFQSNTSAWYYTSSVFRDYSSWYHIIYVIDTTQATSANRCKIYVNGVQQTLTDAGLISQNQDLHFNHTYKHMIGNYVYDLTLDFDGYMTEVNFVDGQALTPSDFGETDTTTGVWKPKRYAGTYGNNGFYLPFKETQQATGFNTVLFTGTNATQSISNVGFSPDLIWFKNRSGANNHALYDSVRGRALSLISNATNSDITSSTGNDLASFDSNGFTVGPIQNHTSTNGSGQSIVAWNWKANGSGVSNTDGSITSTVSANTSSGFSVVTYTGTGSAATIGHGLGIAPSMLIVKRRSDASTWAVYHASLGAGKKLELNGTSGAITNAQFFTSTPTSSVFSLGTEYDVNGSGGTFVSYCFAPIEGYSAFGSYTGNGSADGPFVYTGFRPAFVVVKTINGHADSWFTYDSARDSYNPETKRIKLDTSGSESTDGLVSFDFVSNGFKLRSSNQGWNENGTTYIYAAFAENPFKNSLAR